MQMVCEFTGELVEAVEVGVERVVAVGRSDETTVAKPLEHSVDPCPGPGGYGGIRVKRAVLFLTQ